MKCFAKKNLFSFVENKISSIIDANNSKRIWVHLWSEYYMLRIRLFRETYRNNGTAKAIKVISTFLLKLKTCSQHKKETLIYYMRWQDDKEVKKIPKKLSMYIYMYKCIYNATKLLFCWTEYGTGAMDKECCGEIPFA